jgi:hypothetical protein
MPVHRLDYLIEKFQQALYILATGEGDARSRLEIAHRCFWTILIDDYSKSLRKKRQSIDKLLTRLEGREGYVIPDNLRKMKNKSASKICALIVTLYFDLVQEREETTTDPP